MLDYLNFLNFIENNKLNRFYEAFHQAIELRRAARPFGEEIVWQQAIEQLPQLTDVTACLNQDTVSLSSTQTLNAEQNAAFHNALKTLHPWRKGPFCFFNQTIDTEWRSDWKWQRLAPHISDLSDRRVLDVGCGSGYHLWRMRGAGAKLVVGIEPMLKYLYQFQIIKNYLPDEPVFNLPLKCEDLPETRLFDTVFSMGVLYHRKSPMEHLEELKRALRSGGELVLETLVVDGDKHTVLMPDDRYAAMPNVWFIPSVLMLEHWLKRLNFKNIRCVDVNQTSLNEQRTSPWMTFQSLQDFLDPNDLNKTIEGYPAPKRAIMIAQSP